MCAPNRGIRGPSFRVPGSGPAAAWRRSVANRAGRVRRHDSRSPRGAEGWEPLPLRRGCPCGGRIRLRSTGGGRRGMMEGSRRPSEVPMDANEYIRNKSAWTAEELAPYQGKHVAYSPDGKRILASAGSGEELLAEVARLGVADYVGSFVEPFDEVDLGGAGLELLDEGQPGALGNGQSGHTEAARISDYGKAPVY